MMQSLTSETNCTRGFACQPVNKPLFHRTVSCLTLSAVQLKSRTGRIRALLYIYIRSASCEAKNHTKTDDT